MARHTGNHKVFVASLRALSANAKVEYGPSYDATYPFVGFVTVNGFRQDVKSVLAEARLVDKFTQGKRYAPKDHVFFNITEPTQDIHGVMVNYWGESRLCSLKNYCDECMMYLWKDKEDPETACPDCFRIARREREREDRDVRSALKWARDRREDSPVKVTPVLSPASNVAAIRIGQGATQGRRRDMEDRHVALLSLPSALDVAFVAVYDGHGGSEAAEYCSRELHKNVLNEAHFRSDLKQAIHNGFIQTDQEFLEISARENLKAGCTACAIFVTPSKIYVANAGDSRCVLSRGGTSNPRTEKISSRQLICVCR
jgi:hypothetical protein